MTRAYYLEDGDTPIEMPNELTSSLIPPARMETDVYLKSYSGNVFSYKRRSRRRYSLDYFLGPDDKDLFETQHKSVNGIVTPFFFMEDSADPSTAVLVRKQQHFQPKPIAPGLINGVFGRRWSYTLDLIEQASATSVPPMFHELGEFRGRPTYIEEYDSPMNINSTRTSVEDGTLSADTDADASTFAWLWFHSSASTALNYANLLLSDFPAPPGAIVSATIHVIAEYIPGTSDGVTPYGPGVIEAYVFDQRNPFLCNFSPTGKVGTIFNFLSLGDTAQAKREYTCTFTASEWTSFFSDDVSNVWVRFGSWDSGNYTLVDDAVFRIYDCWIEYVLA